MTAGYSSDVLGRLVEIWSGQPYDVFLQERVFDPLDLTDMGFNVADDDWHRLAEAYAPGEEGSLVNATERLPRAFPCLNESRGIHTPSIL